MEPAAPEKRESLAGVFGVGLGLLLITLCVMSVVVRQDSSAAAMDVLEGELELDPDQLAGLELEPGAHLLPTGEEVLVFTDGSALEVDPAELSSGGGEDWGDSGGWGQGDGFDWGSLEPEGQGALPARIYLVHYPARRGEAVLGRQFRGLEWRDLSDIGDDGGSAVVGGGKLSWSGYEADWVLERRFLAGEEGQGDEAERERSFRDTLRVNLTLGRRVWIAYAIWPESSAGSSEVVESWLEALAPAPLD